MPKLSKLSSEEVINSAKKELEGHGYIASDEIATALYLAQALIKPILIRGLPRSLEVAIASSVFPTPGGPSIRIGLMSA